MTARKMSPEQREQQLWCWLLARHHNGATSSEMARGLGVKRGVIDHARGRLAKEGRVRATGRKRPALGSSCMAAVWVAVDPADEQPAPSAEV